MSESFDNEKILGKIKSLLKSLLEEKHTESISDTFKKTYLQILALFDDFVDLYMKLNDHNTTCSKGCGNCCNHWAYDVYSFEAQIIANHLIDNNADISLIIESITEDEAVFHKLETAVKQKTKELEAENIDQQDALLSAFYLMNRPCEFLNAQGACSIYAIRPMICRAFLNTTDPKNCIHENMFNDESTLIIKLDDECENILDALHVKYGGSDLGLRSQVKKYLELGNQPALL